MYVADLLFLLLFGLVNINIIPIRFHGNVGDAHHMHDMNL